jgi:hypothetical protein
VPRAGSVPGAAFRLRHLRRSRSRGGLISRGPPNRLKPKSEFFPPKFFPTYSDASPIRCSWSCSKPIDLAALGLLHSVLPVPTAVQSQVYGMAMATNRALAFSVTRYQLGTAGIHTRVSNSCNRTKSLQRGQQRLSAASATIPMITRAHCRKSGYGRGEDRQNKAATGLS